MAYQGINTGTSPNSGTGDTLLSGADKINSNFIELFTAVGLSSTGSVGVVTSITAGNNIGVNTSVGSVTVSAVGVVTSIEAGSNISVTTNSGISTISYIGVANTASINAESLVVSGVSTLTNVSAGVVVVSGLSTFADNVVLGTTAANRVTVNALVNSPLVPSLNQVHDLGAPADKWNNVFASAGNFVTLDSGKVSSSSSITADNGFYGDGSGLTNVGMDTSNVSANTLVVSGVSTLGVVTGATYYGDGSGLINLPAGITTSNVSTNTLVVAGVSTFTGNVSCGQSLLLGDNGRILIGDAPDLQIYHDGNNSYIKDFIGTGALRIDSSFTEIRNATGSERAATFSSGTGASGGVQLYFDGVKKFETTSTGAFVTGILTATSLYGDGSNLTGISGITTANINADSLVVTGVSTLTNVVVGTTTEHTLSVTGKVDSNLIPAINQTYNIGKSDSKWNNIYGNIGHFTIVSTSTVSASSSITASSGFYGDASNITSARWVLGADGSTHYQFTGPGGLNATADPVIYLARGQKYEFANNTGAHPFEIRLSNGGAAYTNGITVQGTTVNGTTTFDVPFDAPNSLYYQCTAHAGMGGTVVVYPDLFTV